MAKDLDQNQQTEDTQDQQPVSLRDNIRAAIDEVKEKSEREDNKLDAKSEPATEVKDTSKEDKAPDKTAERKAESKEPEQAELPLDDKKQPEKKAEEVEKKEPKAPFGTPKELRAKWSTLDQDTQGYVSKLLKENLDLKSESGRKSYLRDVDAVLQPYVPAMQQHKISPAVLVKRLLEYSDALGSQQHKYAAIAQLANDFQIDLSVFSAQQQGQQQQNQQQSQVDTQAEYYIPPEVTQELNTIRTELDQFKNIQRSESDRLAKTYVDTWAGFDPNTGEYTKRPYFPYVRQAMYQLIASGAIPIENNSVDLDKAYESACFMSQEIRERVSEDYNREQAMLAARKQQEQQNALKKAKFAGSSIRSSAPIVARDNPNSSKTNSNKPVSIRDSIRAALQEHRA